MEISDVDMWLSFKTPLAPCLLLASSGRSRRQSVSQSVRREYQTCPFLSNSLLPYVCRAYTQRRYGSVFSCLFLILVWYRTIPSYLYLARERTNCVSVWSSSRSRSRRYLDCDFSASRLRAFARRDVSLLVAEPHVFLQSSL